MSLIILINNINIGKTWEIFVTIVFTIFQLLSVEDIVKIGSVVFIGIQQPNYTN